MRADRLPDIQCAFCGANRVSGVRMDCGVLRIDICIHCLHDAYYAAQRVSKHAAMPADPRPAPAAAPDHPTQPGEPT